MRAFSASSSCVAFSSSCVEADDKLASDATLPLRPAIGCAGDGTAAAASDVAAAALASISWRPPSSCTVWSSAASSSSSTFTPLLPVLLATLLRRLELGLLEPAAYPAAALPRNSSRPPSRFTVWSSSSMASASTGGAGLGAFGLWSSAAMSPSSCTVSPSISRLTEAAESPSSSDSGESGGCIASAMMSETDRRRLLLLAERARPMLARRRCAEVGALAVSWAQEPRMREFARVSGESSELSVELFASPSVSDGSANMSFVCVLSSGVRMDGGWL
mmetsp:Transcript_118/g.419  ORF Transcript_118/g.419 Transcript_118/m.419 type:complete len:276 (-) Transcript_118:2290-3117(-)